MAPLRRRPAALRGWLESYRDLPTSWEGIATAVATGFPVATWGALLAGASGAQRILAGLAAVLAGVPIWWSTLRGVWAWVTMRGAARSAGITTSRSSCWRTRF